MFDKSFKKESPILGLLGMGGGIARARAAGGVLGNRSLRFSDTSTYLNRTPGSTTNRTTWTWSGWVKRSSETSRDSLFRASTGGSDYTLLKFRGTGGGQDYRISLDQYGGDNFYVYTNAEFKDFSAWYHVVCAVDTTQGASNNRVRIYVNGVEQATSTSTNYPGDSINTNMNDQNHVHYISYNSGTNVMNGLITDVHFIDGSQLTPSSFGAADSNGVWQRSTYSGSYGTNGFHLLDFANDGTIGNDTSGNGNNFTANGFSTSAGSGIDLLFDFPTNDTANTDAGAGGEVTGNYACINPLLKPDTQTVTLSNGNLDFSSGAASGQYGTRFSSIGVTSGKWYAEFTVGAVSNGLFFGVSRDPNGDSNYIGGHSTSFGYSANGSKYTNNSASSYGDSFTANDVIGLALDLDNGTLTFYKNGTSQGTAYNSMGSGRFFMGVSGTGSATAVCNFGQRPFEDAAPSNHKCLTTTSLPTPGVADGSDYFDQILYVGNQTARSITGLSFSPDLVIVKNRDRAAYNHYWVDSVRGGQKNLYSNSNEAEHDADRITTLDSNGFTLSNHMGPNYNGEDYVSHCWDAGSSDDTNNTDGTITPAKVRANQTAGFSIVSFTGNGTSGATIGHGLNKVPAFWLLKDRDHSDMWIARHTGFANTHYLEFNDTYAIRNAISDVTGDSDPTSSVIPIGSADSNNNGRALIAYIWAPIEGFSAAPSWTGNGDDDGVFIYLGFRPKAFWFKRTDSASNFYVYDSTRSTTNPVNKNLEWNTGDAENTLTSMNVDFLSNGIKVRGDDGDINADGGTYIGFAWAENPFQANGGLAR